METQADRDTLVTLTASLQGWLLDLWEDIDHRLPEYSRDIITYVEQWVAFTAKHALPGLDEGNVKTRTPGIIEKNKTWS